MRRSPSSALSVLFLLIIQSRTEAGSLGHIYALSLNGTTNKLNLLDVDLTTWTIRVGPTLTDPYDVATAEQAAAYDDGTYWTDTFDDFGGYVSGFNVSSMAIEYTLNVSNWPQSGGFLFLDGIFVTGAGDLLVTGNAG